MENIVAFVLSTIDGAYRSIAWPPFTQYAVVRLLALVTSRPKLEAEPIQRPASTSFNCVSGPNISVNKGQCLS